MPRHDWRHDDDTMTREGGRRRGEFGDERSGNGAFFRGNDDSRREDRFGERSSRRDREDRHYGPDDFNRGIPMDETERLIASNKVEGTPVFDRHGDRLGTIHNFMVDKRRGQVVYAVLKHSKGFLGLGERYYPMEWDQLTFDTRLDGYHVDMVEDDLERVGSFDSSGRWESRRSRGETDREGYSRGRSTRDRW